jgi:preprotein translocase subunit SecA
MDWLGVTFPITVTEDEIRPLMGSPTLAGDLVMKRVEQAYETKCAGEDQEVLPYMERGVVLQVIDREWQDYLRAMDDLRRGVNLRAYGQRDPLIEYKREAFGMFENFMNTIKSEIANNEFRATTAVNIRSVLNERNTSGVTLSGPGDEPTAEDVISQARARAEMMGRAERMAQARAMLSARPQAQSAQETSFEPITIEFGSNDEEENNSAPAHSPSPVVHPGAGARPLAMPIGGASRWSNVGRNDPCPCGSGKKFKKCHGASQF